MRCCWSVGCRERDLVRAVVRVWMQGRRWLAAATGPGAGRRVGGCWRPGVVSTEIKTGLKQEHLLCNHLYVCVCWKVLENWLQHWFNTFGFLCHLNWRDCSFLADCRSQSLRRLTCQFRLWMIPIIFAAKYSNMSHWVDNYEVTIVHRKCANMTW